MSMPTLAQFIYRSLKLHMNPRDSKIFSLFDFSLKLFLFVWDRFSRSTKKEEAIVGHLVVEHFSD